MYYSRLNPRVTIGSVDKLQFHYCASFIQRSLWLRT